MLIALLACWSFQGHPIYWFMSEEQFPVYISDVGATNLQPIFIACAGFQGIFFVASLALDKYLRSQKKLLPCLSEDEKRLSWCLIVFACISMLGITFTAIFKTNRFHHVHLSMVSIFIVFAFLLTVCNVAQYFLLYKSYPNENVKGINRFLFSAVLKIVWICLSIVFAVCFGVFMRDDRDSLSACFEWTLSFWYGILLCLFAFDLSPIRKTHHLHVEPKDMPVLPNETGSYSTTV